MPPIRLQHLLWMSGFLYRSMYKRLSLYQKIVIWIFWYNIVVRILYMMPLNILTARSMVVFSRVKALNIKLKETDN